MKKLVSMLLIAVFLTSLIATVPNAASSTTPRPSLEDVDPAPIDGTPNLEGVVCSWAQPDTGNTWTVIVSDEYYGGFYYQDFECVLSGAHCNIWIGLNDTVWAGGYHDEFVDYPGFDNDTWYFAYPWSSVGYGRMTAGYRDVIYGSQLTFVLNQFDNNIWQKDTTFFGGYNYRPGPLGDGKIQILVFNIRDQLFYDIVHASGFIGGYYWYYASNLNNANIIHIDTYQWWRRQGPNPPGTAPYVNPPYPSSMLWPYQYEGTIAHEFQHLIHRDNDADELSWVNEGCSTLAEYICGYGVTSNLYYYIAYWWSTSLVIWQGNLEDYGVVFLWTVYMYEHYGGQKLIWDVVHEQANGIAGWNKVLKAHHIRKNFDEIFQDWAIANYLDDTSFAKGIYGYYGFDIPCKASNWWDIPYSIWYWEQAYPTLFDTQVTTYPTEGYNYPYGASLPYVVNYVEFYNGEPDRPASVVKVNFDGDDYCGVPAHSGTYEWYSDGAAWSWFRLDQTFDLTGVTTATLKFWTYYEMEEDWDYGYVEVHDLTTDEWYTLSGVTTISTLTVQDNPNCPPEFEPSNYSDVGRWNAFTGYAPGYYQETMDLTPFAGHNIELYFTYWTDGAVNWLGWYVDDIEIPEIGFSDNVEGGTNGWTYNGWYTSTGILLNDFEVNFIETLNIKVKDKEKTIYHISSMHLCPETEEGWEILPFVNTTCVKSGPSVMVAANQPGYEHTLETFYYFTAEILPHHGPC
jgi:hypothetical protein